MTHGNAGSILEPACPALLPVRCRSPRPLNGQGHRGWASLLVIDDAEPVKAMGAIIFFKYIRDLVSN